jgi:hypothetical protein
MTLAATCLEFGNVTPGSGNRRAPGNRSADHTRCLSILAAASVTHVVKLLLAREATRNTLRLPTKEVTRPE